MASEIQKLTNALGNSGSKVGGTRRHHPLSAVSTTITADATGQLSTNRSRMGRHASISTATVLNAVPDDAEDALALRIVEMFKDPNKHLTYIKSEEFAQDILTLAGRVRPILEDEPRVIFLQSPCYVFGDIHGNLEDLHFFSDNIWRLGMSLTAGNFLFLGDYVDRGMSCLEVVAYLFAMKLLLPHKVFLLRGNHETRDVNGWEEHYGDRSYIHQCRERFGEEVGYRVWEETNQVFDRIPLSAVIDQDIFCVHGGIPRAVSSKSRIQDILNVPKVAGINPPYEHETEEYQQVASDCIWSDPASDEQEAMGVDPNTGFGESLRGGGAICFGHKAVTNFLQQQGYSYIMRAHEAHAEGVAVSKGARVFTVFSTSKDHNQGSQAMAGCILVDFEKMKVINRSPAYKNKFVHRRDSVSLAGMTEAEIAQRADLGLVTAADDVSEGYDEYDVSNKSDGDSDDANNANNANDDDDSGDSGDSGDSDDDDDDDNDTNHTNHTNHTNQTNEDNDATTTTATTTMLPNSLVRSVDARSMMNCSDDSNRNDNDVSNKRLHCSSESLELLESVEAIESIDDNDNNNANNDVAPGDDTENDDGNVDGNVDGNADGDYVGDWESSGWKLSGTSKGSISGGISGGIRKKVYKFGKFFGGSAAGGSNRR
jgi:hypothetical protein